MPRKRKISKTQKATYNSWVAIRKKQIDELTTHIKNNRRLTVEHRKQINRNRRAIATLNAWITRDRKRVAVLQDKIAKIMKRMR